MNTVVSGRFPDTETLQGAQVALASVGFGRSEIAVHGVTPTDAEPAPEGDVGGSVVAMPAIVVAGVTVPLFGPATPGVDDHLLAVQVVKPGRRDTAIRVMRDCGATGVGVSEGRIVDSQWTDGGRLPAVPGTP